MDASFLSLNSKHARVEATLNTHERPIHGVLCFLPLVLDLLQINAGDRKVAVSEPCADSLNLNPGTITVWAGKWTNDWTNACN